MSRALTVARLLVLAVLLAFGRAATAAAADEAVVSAQSPGVQLSLVSPAPAGAVLILDIVAVTNPARAPVSLRVSLFDRQAPAVTFEVLRVGLFPSDRPARFVGRADAAIAQLAARCAQGAPALSALVELDPSGGASGSSAAVELRVAVRWADAR